MTMHHRSLLLSALPPYCHVALPGYRCICRDDREQGRSFAMLGPASSRCLDEPLVVSLEALVRASNFYRHLEATLDLSFVRDWVRDLYAERGRPGIDPVVFFKLQLVMFFEGIRSERKLIETASLNLAHRWYLGYALDEEVPDHSSLTRIRLRLGVDIFQRFFERVVDLCQDNGLVWGQELYFDATKVRADATDDSLVPRYSHEAKANTTALFANETVEDEPGTTDAGRASLETSPPRSVGLLWFSAKGDRAIPAATQATD